MAKKFILAIILICFALVTFFGIGPVLFADGSTVERMTTLFIVLIIYFILIKLFRAVRRSR